MFVEKIWNPLRKRGASFLPWKALIAAAILLLLAPRSASGQFGLDPCCAIISAGLKSISGLLSNVVARPLSAMQQIRQQTADFERQVVYPVAAINNARQLSGQLEAQLQRMSSVYRLPLGSASLPAPQQFERSLLSRDPEAVEQVSQSYAALYGTVMAPADAPQPIRDLVDMSDAVAQAALKKALELDALADIELAAAQQIGAQIQNASPGSAPILEAQAAAWVVRANAYTQSAIAELVRIRSIDLANAGAQLKFSARDLNTLDNSASQTLQRGVR